MESESQPNPNNGQATPGYNNTDKPPKKSSERALFQPRQKSQERAQPQPQPQQRSQERDLSQPQQRALSNWQRLSYGVGHVLNDLTASMWFSYLLIYLTEVGHFDDLLAGNLILIGQIADAICTPFIGYESDLTKKGICNLGKRKSWHFIGTVCVLVSFPFIFEPCITCSNTPSAVQMVYFAPFVVIFQFGWASVQISHLSFSSDLTPYKHERVILQSIRNFFTIFANISVFGIFALLFYVESDSVDSKNTTELSRSDVPQFRYLTFICLGLGILFNVIFYTGTAKTGSLRKTDPRNSSNINNAHQERESAHSINGPPRERCSVGSSYDISTRRSRMTWKDWLKEHQFYQVSLLYMFTRLYFNISQVYLGIYLTKTIKMKKIYVAVLPLFTYSSSFITSALAPVVNKRLGRKPSFFVGALFGVGSSVWLYFIQTESHQIYGGAVFLGMAGSMLLITSLSMTSDLIATNVESGAFVFGAMSFTDKLANGITIVLIEMFDPCSQKVCPAGADYYRLIETFVPGGAIFAALIILMTLVPQRIGYRGNRNNCYDPSRESHSGNTRRSIYTITVDDMPLAANSGCSDTDLSLS